MVLPPEQFHIKRRREEEPVETLYIQSELHQKKRRFTDFIFQRVQLGGGTKGNNNNNNNNNNNVADADTAGAAPTSTASTPGQGRVRSPRSVSTSFFPKRASGSASVPSPSPAAAGRRVNAGGVPVIRATSPGAEFREERALAAARRKQEEAKQERVKESVQLVQQSVAAAAAAGEQESEGDETKTTAATTSSSTTTTTTTTKTTTPSFPTSIRRFHISRPNTPTSPLKTAAGSGVAKSSTPTRTRVVLVEKLTQTPSLRGASILETLERAEKNQTGKEIDTVIQSQLVREEDRRPQKRPVVNQAEKKWREQQKDSISAAKEHLATKESQDDDYLDRLARDLELVMLDIESEESHMDGVSLDGPSKPVTTTTQATPVKPNRTPLKYMPRHPTPRKPADTTKEPDSTTTTTTKERKDEDMDEGYVYDTYIRIPVPRSTDGLTDPLSDTSTPTPSTPHDIDPTRKDIGLVVITEEDEDLWENFLENDDSDEENWDGEDVDSNAEDNPANDYPDEDLSSADENDDPTAVYRRYRHAGSDDEEFDVNYYDENDDDDNDNDSEGEIRNRRYDNDEDEDDKTLGRARRLQNFYRQQDAQRVGKVSDDEDDDDMF